MMDGSVNEFSYSVTSMVRTRDILNPTDIAIYRALAGGVTAQNLLHGSANPIGGQNTVVKNQIRSPVEDFLIPDAPPGIKFALGENVKRSNYNPQPGAPRRYPATRMGVVETIRDAFLRAKDYKQKWDDYRAKKTKVIAAPRFGIRTARRNFRRQTTRSFARLSFGRTFESIAFSR